MKQHKCNIPNCDGVKYELFSDKTLCEYQRHFKKVYNSYRELKKIKKDKWQKTIGMTALFTKDGSLIIYPNIEFYQTWPAGKETIVIGGIIQKVNRGWVYLFIPPNKVIRIRKKLVRIK